MRRLVIAAAVILVGVIALGVILIVQGDESGSRTQLLDSLTRGAATERAILTQRANSTSMVLANRTLTAARPTRAFIVTAVSPIAAETIDLSDYFTINLDDGQSPTIAADGASSRRLCIAANDERAAGKQIVFVVFGGGRVTPETLILPPPTSQPDCSIEYTAGLSATTIRIEAVLNNAIGRASVNITSEADYFQLNGEDDPEQIEIHPATGLRLVPFTVRVDTSSQTGRAISGEYAVQINATDGSVVNSNYGRVNEFSLKAGSSEQTFFFMPDDADKTSGRILASVVNREDVQPFNLLICWIGCPSSVEFTNEQDYYDISLNGTSTICVRTQDSDGQPVVSPVLRMNNRLLLDANGVPPAAPPVSSLNFGGGITYPDTWIELVGDTAVRGASSNNMERCVSMSLPNGEAGRLVRLDVQTDDDDIHDTAYALLYSQSGRVLGGDAALPLISANSAAQLQVPRGTALATGFNLARSAMMPTIPVIIPLWVRAENVDASNSLTFQGGTALMMYADQQGRTAVIVAGEIPSAFVLPGTDAFRRVFIVAQVPFNRFQPPTPTPLPTFTPANSATATASPISAGATASHTATAIPLTSTASPRPPTRTPTRTFTPVPPTPTTAPLQTDPPPFVAPTSITSTMMGLEIPIIEEPTETPTVEPPTATAAQPTPEPTLPLESTAAAPPTENPSPAPP